MKTNVNKILGMIIVTVFLIGMLPATIADGTPNSGDSSGLGQGTNKTQGIEGNHTDEGEDNEVDDYHNETEDNETDDDHNGLIYNERIKERLKEIQEERLERLKELKQKPEWAKYNETLGWKARIIDRMQVEKAKENYIKAKEKFILKKADLEQSRLKFKEKQELKKVCREQGQDKCNVTEEQLLSVSKNFLGNSADAIIEHLNKVKTRLQGNEDLSEEEVKAMIERIDAKITQIQAAKEKAMNATTKDEVTSAAQEINAAWKNIKQISEAYTNEMMNAQIGGIIIKSEQLKEKFDRAITKMESNNKSTDGIKPLVGEYDTKIKLAKEKYESAMKKFQEFWDAENKPEAKEILEQAKDLMKEAKEALKDANEKLREITKAIKKANGQQELAEETNQTSKQ
jgi:hypothetical protein